MCSHLIRDDPYSAWPNPNLGANDPPHCKQVYVSPIERPKHMFALHPWL